VRKNGALLQRVRAPLQRDRAFLWRYRALFFHTGLFVKDVGGLEEIQGSSTEIGLFLA